MSVIHKRGEACLICAPSSEFWKADVPFHQDMLGGRRREFWAWPKPVQRQDTRPALCSFSLSNSSKSQNLLLESSWTKMMDSFLSLLPFYPNATNSFCAISIQFTVFYEWFSTLLSFFIWMGAADPPLIFPSTTTTTQSEPGEKKFQLKLLSHHSHLKQKDYHQTTTRLCALTALQRLSKRRISYIYTFSLFFTISNVYISLFFF